MKILLPPDILIQKGDSSSLHSQELFNPFTSTFIAIVKTFVITLITKLT